MTEYHRRILDDQLDELLPGLAAISIEGAHATGKTATATRRAATIHSLDDSDARAIAVADPRRLVAGAPPILIDEWQRLPQSWDLVRRAVDADRRPGRFLLTGSASPRNPPTHSGAGRIVPIRLRPMSLAERGVETPTVSLATLMTGRRDPVGGSTGVTLDHYVHEILASGFPGLRDVPERSVTAYLDGYLERIVDRDFEDAGLPIRSARTLRRWMQAYAAATASTASLETIRKAASGGDVTPSKATVGRYTDVLHGSWILDPVPGWGPTTNELAKLTLGPKHHLADPALAARLCRATKDSLLRTDAAGRERRTPGLLGALFESLVTLGVRVYARAAEADVFHFRDRGGIHEVDLIVEGPGMNVVAIEIKLASTVSDDDVRHLAWLERRLGPRLLDAVVVTTGREAYRRRDGIAVVPAALLGP